MQYRNILLALEVVVGWLLSLSLLSPTLAQAEQCQPSSGGKITCASVEDVENSVLLYSSARQKFQEPVQRGTLLFPDDILHTLSDSSAEILFNDGSILRSAPATNFSFQPNLNIQLIDGKVLVMEKPGSGGSEVQTAEATVTAGGAAFLDLAKQLESWKKPVATVKAPGTAFLVIHRAGRRETLVKVLIDSLVTVTSKKGQTVTLRSGQTVTVTPEKIALVQTFNLREFYTIEPLARCLGPEQQCTPNTESPIAQETISDILPQICNAIKNQSSPTSFPVNCPQTPGPQPRPDPNHPTPIVPHRPGSSNPNITSKPNGPNPPAPIDSSSPYNLSSVVQPWNDPNPPASIGSPILYYLDPSSALQPGNLTRIAPN